MAPAWAATDPAGYLAPPRIALNVGGRAAAAMASTRRADRWTAWRIRRPQVLPRKRGKSLISKPTVGPCGLPSAGGRPTRAAV